MDNTAYGQAMPAHEVADWEARLLAEPTLVVELPCSMAELDALLAAHGTSRREVTIASCGHVRGRDVMTLHLPQAVPVRRFEESAASDDCAGCGHDLASHGAGLACP